ncbi:MAG: AI-2E family transporter [Candidatus Riflebacteria bacterium]|nr:AI-2E family transporter [Candidatus Riflebacteria bacterium]
MPVENIPDRGIRFLLSVASLTIIIYGINQAQSFLISFLVAVFFAVLGTPPVLWLEKKSVPNVIAVLIVITGMISILLIAGAIVGASISSFFKELPVYQAHFKERIADFQLFLANKGIHGVDKLFLAYFNPESVMSLTGRLFAGLGSALSDILLILLTVAFILIEASTFPVKLRTVLGHPRQGFPQFTKFVDDMERYVLIHTVFSLATGLLIGIWMFIIDMDFPVIWGFLAFLLNYVPNVGSIIAAVPAVLLAFVQFGMGSMILTVAGYLVINFILGNVLEVMFMGQSLDLSTLVVFLSLVFWGSLLGPVGMVLCIPLSMTLKFACENNDDTKWIAELLASEIPAKATATK